MSSGRDRHMDTLDAFRLYLLREKGQKTSTTLTNAKLLRKLLHEVSPFTPENIQNYINQMIDAGRDVGYINQHIVVLHYYGEFKGLPEVTKWPYVKLKDRDDYVRATMTDDELQAFTGLYSIHPVGSSFWKRDQMWTLYWLICSYEGFRPGETARLRRKDCDLSRNVFILPDTKTGHRVVPISFVLRNRLSEYLADLSGEHLFPSFRKSEIPYMRSQAWIEDFKKRIKRLAPLYPDLARRENLTPHSIRHSFATRLVDEDFSLSKIQAAMGHKKLETTQKYVHMSLKSIETMLDNDRLSRRHKGSQDIVSYIKDYILSMEKNYKNKIRVSVRKVKEKHIFEIVEITDEITT